MAKVKLKVTMAGPTVFWPDGSVIEVSEMEAESLVAAGYADRVADEVEEPPVIVQKVEKAVETPKAEWRGRKRKR